LIRHDPAERGARHVVYRLVLDAGKHWFADDDPRVPLRLVDGTVTSTGAILATYERAAS
jgi:hypothetical protein